MKTELYVLQAVTSGGLLQKEFVESFDPTNEYFDPTFNSELSKAMRGTEKAMTVLATLANRKDQQVILRPAK
jgi:hypothetical protein